MRVLVTGGTGYLGAAIVRELASRGHQPVIFARRASSAGLPGVPIDGDIRDRGALARAAQAVDAIIHTAALVSIWREHPREFDDVNVGGLHNVLAVARAAGIARVVYTSTFLALPPNGSHGPIEGNDYQRTKQRAREEAVRALADGSPLVILYPGVVYGPGASTEGNLVGRLLRDHRDGRLPGLVGASRLWSFAYVDDVASAHVEAVERPEARGEYLVGGVNAPQMRLFEVARALTGTSLPRRIPLAAARAAGALDELRARMFGRTPLITRATVEIFSHDWSMDSSRAMRELGYHVTSLETGVASTLAALSQHGHSSA
ncbi:MAG TPA: NAD-dependent epimerase/dehydratase family protein [Vicinamibacterales bacterium]|nr:NAD-dependent epimerase/dehydratase family protein [Vicinamibacterales bacterium]